MKRGRFKGGRQGNTAEEEDEETCPEIRGARDQRAEALENIFEEIKEKIRKSGAPVGDQLRFPDFKEYLDSRLNV